MLPRTCYVIGLAGPEVELGQPDRRPTVPGLRGVLRYHLHLRRAAHHDRRTGARHRRRSDPGLYAAELVGGLFYFNYPGGTGLISGAVFGRIAGHSAGAAASG